MCVFCIPLAPLVSSPECRTIMSPKGLQEPDNPSQPYRLRAQGVAQWQPWVPTPFSNSLWCCWAKTWLKIPICITLLEVPTFPFFIPDSIWLLNSKAYQLALSLIGYSEPFLSPQVTSPYRVQIPYPTPPPGLCIELKTTFCFPHYFTPKSHYLVAHSRSSENIFWVNK